MDGNFRNRLTTFDTSAETEGPWDWERSHDPQTSPPPGTAGCTASVSLNAWTGGFVATVRVTAGTSPITGWRVGLILPSGVTISNAWNANHTGNSGAVQFTNVNYNGSLAAGAYTEFGFQATGPSSTMTPTCTTA